MNRTYPKTAYNIPRPKRETLTPSYQQPPPFRPVSAAVAKEEVSRPFSEVRGVVGWK